MLEKIEAISVEMKGMFVYNSSTFISSICMNRKVYQFGICRRSKNYCL